MYHKLTIMALACYLGACQSHSSLSEPAGINYPAKQTYSYYPDQQCPEVLHIGQNDTVVFQLSNSETQVWHLQQKPKKFRLETSAISVSGAPESEKAAFSPGGILEIYEFHAQNKGDEIITFQQTHRQNAQVTALWECRVRIN